MKRRLALLGFTVLVGCLVFALAACTIPVQGENGGENTGEMGTFHIRLGSGSASRAVVPYPPTTQTELDQLTFKVQFIKNGSVIATFNSDGDDRIDGKVAQGTYTVRVEVSIIADGTLFAAGSKDPITIKPGPNPTITVDVYEAGIVSITPNPVSLYQGSTQQFTAAVSGYAGQAFNWAVSGGTGTTSISASGLLTVDASQTLGSLTVTAEWQTVPPKSETALVSIVTAGTLTGSVSISGNPYVGVTLTSNTGSLGGDGTIVYQWQWYNGGSPIDISGATNSTYTITSTDLGKEIVLKVERVGGGYSGDVSSGPSATVTWPLLTGTVSISGNSQVVVVGTTLTAVTSSLGGSGTISYQWERYDPNTGTTIDIPGATSATYTTVSADTDCDILVRVERAENIGSRTSNAVTVMQPVTNITGVPGSATVNTPLTLTGTVNPSNATNQTIVWSVQNAGGTGANITSGNTFNATTTGTATVRATIADGTAVGTNYTQDFSITVSATFVVVTNITGPTAAIVGTGLTLSGTVVPSNATNQTIVWTVQSAGTTGATISESAGVYTLNATAAGTATVRATIANGMAIGTDYTQDFSVTVKLPFDNVSAVATGRLWHTVAIKTDGSLWAWGRNESGQFGDGSTTSSNIPVQESLADYNWATVTAGDQHTVALKTNGTLWACGYNYYGQLGLGDNIDRNVPERIGTLTWTAVAAGCMYTVAIRNNGTLWTWGDNAHGQLGIGVTTDRDAPVQVGTATWVTVAAGTDHSVAIRTDGTLWAWGGNSNGQLGDGTVTQRTSPVQIGLDTWKAVAAGQGYTIAIKTDGSLWAWGSGLLGDGNTIGRRLVPVRIRAVDGVDDLDWKAVSTGHYHTLAIKTDGSLWAWGPNDSGQLGDGTTTDRNVPVQIAGTWNAVSAGGDEPFSSDACGHTVAIRSDGSLWVWGYNGYGQLGLGDTTNRLVPTQVPAP